MIRIIYRFVILILLILMILITYLSTVGVKTNKFNNQITNHIKNINTNLDIELRDVNIILDPFNLTFLVKTIGTNLVYRNKIIQFEKIESKISIRSLLNNEFSLSELTVSTKLIKVKNLISFLRVLNKDPKLFIAEKFVKKGFLIINAEIEFDENGNFKNNYEISGFIKDGSVDLLTKYNLSKINSNFNLVKNDLKIDNLNLSLNGQDLTFSNIEASKLKDKFFIKGKSNNNNVILEENEIVNYVGNDLFIDLKKIEFKSSNDFSLQIDKNFKFENLNINSYIDLKELVFLEKDLNNFFPEIKDQIKLINHQINLSYNKNDLKIKGSGKFLIQEEDKIQYEISTKNGKIDLSTLLEIKNNKFLFSYLNYEKKDESSLEIKLKLDKDKKDNITFKEISLNDQESRIKIKNLSLKNDLTINGVKKIELDYFDKEDVKNKILFKKTKKNYVLKGDSLNINKIIEDLLLSENKKKNILNQNFWIDVDVKKVFLDKKNFINNLKGHISIKDNVVDDVDLISEFLSKKEIKFTLKNMNNQKITTLFSGEAKPLVDRYEFIKGFNEGSLDFYSLKNNGLTNSTLKIYDFKLRELPALTKLLTLASLQGIADLLSGEGIRFNEFEMKFSNENNLMTIDEIYAIGPAISILMSGYVEKNKLISLRGTLVPATTLNKTIGSIPILGDILVGDKTGEGVFGVSFKIKGPPKELETTVNPIKTLTPRFITRTLEKIKKN